MPTLTLNYREDLSYTTLLHNKQTKENELLKQISKQIFDFKLANKYCLNTCYMALFVYPLSAGGVYTLNDICYNIKGILSQNLYSMLINLSNIGVGKEIKDSLYNILHDCMSYEVFNLLRVNPVNTYGVLLYYYVLLYDLPKLKTCSDLIHEAVSSTQPTLAWEKMYLFFEEEVLK